MIGLPVVVVAASASQPTPWWPLDWRSGSFHRPCPSLSTSFRGRIPRTNLLPKNVPRHILESAAIGLNIINNILSISRPLEKEGINGFVTIVIKPYCKMQDKEHVTYGRPARIRGEFEFLYFIVQLIGSATYRNQIFLSFFHCTLLLQANFIIQYLVKLVCWPNLILINRRATAIVCWLGAIQIIL